jgi:hypothetical protein
MDFQLTNFFGEFYMIFSLSGKCATLDFSQALAESKSDVFITKNRVVIIHHSYIVTFSDSIYYRYNWRVVFSFLSIQHSIADSVILYIASRMIVRAKNSNANGGMLKNVLYIYIRPINSTVT